MTERPEPTCALCGTVDGTHTEHVRTTGPTAYDPPADPIAALRDAMARIDAATREVLIHPDTPAVVVERITSASPLVRVRRSTLVPRPDVVLVSRPDGQDPFIIRAKREK